jgi:predicted PurR-regulated permease PerM
LIKTPVIGTYLDAYWNQLPQDKDYLYDQFVATWDSSKKWILNRGKDLGKGFFQLILSVFISFFFYRDGSFVVDKIKASVNRIAGDRTQHLLRVVGGTVQGVVYGVLGTALAQSILATIGFYVCKAPSPLLLGFLTFFFSLIPMGPPLIWLPASLWLITQGHTIAGTILALWGIGVVSTIDNFLKPYLISRGSSLPFVLVLLGVMGGVLAFGVIGVFLGPTILAVGYSLAMEWSEEAKPEIAPRE